MSNQVAQLFIAPPAPPPGLPLTLAAFRDFHQGATILVCGCGASLNELTCPERFITIGVNDVGRLFDPTYLVVLNPRNQFTGDRFRYVEQSRAQAIFTQLDLGIPHPHVVRFPLGRYGGADFSNPEVLHYTSNSPYLAVCLAVHLGARRIGLIGVDFTDHHFFASTGKHVLAARLDQIEREYSRLAEACRALGREVFNLSPTSRLTAIPKRDWSQLGSGMSGAAIQRPLKIVSYATTPVAGVPLALARCIEARTPHEAHCVWARNDYGNGVRFESGIEWTRCPAEAEARLREAEVVIVHNGKVEGRHAELLEGKAIVTMAHNYMWNVDCAFIERGYPGVVVGQYQATLSEFAGWQVVPNPVPLWEPAYCPEPKPEVVTVCYTPSGMHERYPPGHRLYWHGKGFQTTMRILERLAGRAGVKIEATGHGQVSHAQALAMKRRAHIVIDECVTGSYHRNSLEGLASGCVVINGVGSLPGVVEVFQHCAPGADRVPFVFSTLDSLEDVLLRLIERGPHALGETGRGNRKWMEEHWNFGRQWEQFWAPVIDGRPQLGTVAPMSIIYAPDSSDGKKEPAVTQSQTEAVSVIIPHSGADRLPLLAATLVTLRQRPGIGEIIVVEMGTDPLARSVTERWADKHLFIEHRGAFERARALNAGETIAKCDLLLWHDNDLLIPPEFVLRAVQELRDRGLDYLIPYTTVRYLSESDSKAVISGTRHPSDCRPVNTFYSGRRAHGSSGGMGLVRRDFLKRCGGLIEGFRGWGGEDNAWNHKASLHGRAARTVRQDQHVHHLFHQFSGGYGAGLAGSANPHYAENVALLARVGSVRTVSEFSRHFPAVEPSAGVLTHFPSSAPARRDVLPVWTYWEGPCPKWIHACRRTIAAFAPRAVILSPESFDKLRDRDRDIDLSGLHAPHRADYIRVFLLQRYGGLWIDADCLVMQPLQPVLDLLSEHDFLGHRERSGLISNGFIAARPGSRIAAAFYERVCRALRARRPLGWTTIGSEPLSAVVAEDARGWHELPCERVQPICWSQPEKFFEERTPVEHEQAFDPRAICYMLSNGAIRNYAAKHPGADLMKSTSFFSFLLGRALRGIEEDAPSPYEEIFAAHIELYRRHRSESLSGPGSSLDQTKELRERLPLALEALSVRSLLDAPCGDFNWMQHVQLGVERYIGIDVLREIVAENEWRHSSGQRRFIHGDLTRNPLPQADAILCRDFLTHLSFAEILAVLRNFKRSGARYLLTTTFTGARPNRDTSGGEWRTLNLTLPPFDFPTPKLVINEKCTEGGGSFGDKSLGVWVLSELPVDVRSH